MAVNFNTTVGRTNARMVDIQRSQPIGNKGNYQTVHDLIQQSDIELRYLDTDRAIAGSNFMLVSTADTGAGTVALTINTNENNGGYMASVLAGAVGAGATTTVTNTLGEILNLVAIVDADTQSVIQNASGRDIFGLMQAGSTTLDGDAIGAGGSENLQISFVSIGEDGATLTLETITATIDVAVPRVYAMKNKPLIKGKTPDIAIPNVIAPSGINVLERTLTVTADYAQNEVINISTGVGSITGTSTITGDVITLPASSGAFNADGKYTITVVGIGELDKGTDVVWDTATSFHFTNVAFSIGDRIIIKQLTIA